MPKINEECLTCTTRSFPVDIDMVLTTSDRTHCYFYVVCFAVPAVFTFCSCAY